MKFTLKNYKGEATEHDLVLDNVSKIDLLTMSGDQLLVVTYKDGSSQKYDSCDSRELNLLDGMACIYDASWPEARRNAELARSRVLETYKGMVTMLSR